MTVVLHAAGDKTEMVFTQAGDHMDDAGYERATAGWQSFFDTLAALLADAS